MLKKIRDEIRFLNLTEHTRVENYIKKIEEWSDVDDEIRAETKTELKEIIKDRVMRIKRLGIIIGLIYIGIYFTFFSILFSDLFLLSEIAILLGKLIGFFGTTILFILLFICSHIRGLYYQDLNLLSAHIISIISENKKEKGRIFEDLNKYNSFISFFKKRGF